MDRADDPATSGTNRLVRKIEEVARASFLELFFDVVFVFALRALAEQLLDNLNWSGAFHALVLLLAVGYVWSTTARVTEQLNPERPAVQALVIATMVGALVLSAAVPEAFGKTGLIFAVTYVCLQVGRNLFMMFLLRGHELQRVSIRAVAWNVAMGVPLVTGAFASGAARTALWTLAVVLLYVARWFNYPLPGPRRLVGGGRLPPAAEYLAERHRALFVIGLGEVILTIGASLTSRGYAAIQTVAFVMTFAITALIWRLYIYRAGENIGPAIEASAKPERLGSLVTYAHVIMLAGLVLISVGAELTIDNPLNNPHAAATVTILGGPALFLAGRSLLAYVVFSYVPKGRLAGLLALPCLVPPMLLVPPLGTTIVTAAVLLGAVIADNKHDRLQRFPISPPGPHRHDNK